MTYKAGRNGAKLLVCPYDALEAAEASDVSTISLHAAQPQSGVVQRMASVVPLAAWRDGGAAGGRPQDGY